MTELRCLQVDVVVAKTFMAKFEAGLKRINENDEQERLKLLSELTVTRADLRLMASELSKEFTVFGNMDYETYLDYYKFLVFDKKADGSYGLVVSNLQDEKGNVDLGKFFVGMFIPNLYPEDILQRLDFNSSDAYRYSGPWARFSWGMFATQVTSIPGRSSLSLVKNGTSDRTNVGLEAQNGTGQVFQKRL